MLTEGTVIGDRYRLIKEIGQGGMAVIWSAEHLTLGSPVAVKFLFTGGPKPEEMVGRFMREARVAAAVRHRNVIEITDFGVSDDGRTPYMVMELLEGESLADRLDHSQVLDPRFATQIIWLTLRGLAAVHDSGIVHRDLKPENIYLVTDSDGTYPKLLDFGVSRETSDDSKLTQEGILVGTPSYMSPEQARGLRDIDLRTDLYSMGVLLYELLAGQLPFDSENPGDLIVMITRDTPPPLRTLRGDLPQGIYDWVERAMAKDREERFQDAREMRWALAEACTEFGFGADRETGVSRVSEFPGIGGPSAMRPGQDSRLLPGGAEPRNQATEQLSLDELAAIHVREPLGTPESKASPPPRRGGGRLLVSLGVLLAVAVGVVAAVVVPASPFVQEGLSGVVLGEAEAAEPVAAPWVPQTESMPEGILSEGPPSENESGVLVRLHGIPEGAVASIEGVGVGATGTWIPVADESYQVEVRRDGAAVWRIEHPGNVDGEYEVWPMSEEELASTAAAPAEEEGSAAEQAAPTMRRRSAMRRRPAMRRRAMRRRR